QAQVARIVREAAARLGAKIARRVPELVASYTIEGRKAVQILADAYGHALERAGGTRGAAVREEDVLEVVQAGRIVQHSPTRARRAREIGKAHGLGVIQYVGSIVEIEAAAFAAREKRKGTVRFNDTAGSMARDAVFNATSVIRAVAGVDPAEHDLHVNVVGGGNIDGPSAGLAFFLALYSALAHVRLPQDVAVTGEVSLVGNVRAVGGVVEKLYAARQAGMRALVLPRENAREIEAAPEGIEVIAVGNVAEALAAIGLRVPAPLALRARPRTKASR
ncbi:MAG TPA: S16 family serine protease, partial [Usitatibacter sp.]